MIAPVDVTDLRIETERLILRPWRESDLEDFYEYARVDGVGQMAGWLPHESMEVSKAILDSFIHGKKTLALELKENGKVIGSLGLEDRSAQLDVSPESMGRELGYVLSKAYWGRGLMPEAVKAVIDYCFTKLDFEWLTCGHFVRNQQSRRVIEKCGFRYVGDILHETRYGTQEQTKLYLLLNEDKIFLRMNAPFDVTGVTLETERLLLRPLEEADLQAFHEISLMPEVAEFSGWECSETMEDSRVRLERHLKEKESFALVLKQTGALIGTFSLQARNWPSYPIDQNLKGREFGFELSKYYWGRGLMPEAVHAITEYCFNVLDYDFVSAGYFLGNDRSFRVIQKCGFDFLFEAEHTFTPGKPVTIRTHIRYNPKKEK